MNRVAIGLLVLSISTIAYAATDLEQAESYVNSGMFSQAEGLCNSIVQNNPGSDYALKAQGKLAVIDIMTARMPQADTTVEALINNFHNNAELPAILYGIMGRYKQARELQRAENLSSRICQEFPASEQAQRIQLDSGKEQTLKLIADGKFAQAEETVNTMVAGAGSNPAMPATLFKIAREFKEVGRYDETGRIYQRIVQSYPNSDFTAKARMGIDKLAIWNLIKAGDVNSVQAALNKLISDYSGNDDLPHTVHGVALKFEEAGFYEEAKNLYQNVKIDYAGTDIASKATLDLQKCDIRAMVGTSSHSSVIQKVNELMTEFAGHWYLPKAVWQIGAEYYNRAMKLESQGSKEQAKEFYRNAVAVWERVISMPRSSSAAEACNYAAVCYEKVGEYAKANQCYQKVIDNYPGYRMRWNMMFKVGQNYQEMKKAGTIAASEADAKTRAVYEKLLNEYPACKVASHIRKLLGR